MPRRVILTARAVADVSAAIRYLHIEAGPRTVETFEHEVDRTLSLLQTFPGAAPVYRGEYRRLSLSRFRYTLYYRADTDSLVIVALEHQCRDPRRLRLG